MLLLTVVAELEESEKRNEFLQEEEPDVTGKIRVIHQKIVFLLSNYTNVS